MALSTKLMTAWRSTSQSTVAYTGPAASTVIDCRFSSASTLRWLATPQLAITFHSLDGKRLYRIAIQPSPRPVFVKEGRATGSDSSQWPAKQSP
jgi:hypothetical protein